MVGGFGLHGHCQTTNLGCSSVSLLISQLDQQRVYSLNIVLPQKPMFLGFYKQSTSSDIDFSLCAVLMDGHEEEDWISGLGMVRRGSVVVVDILNSCVALGGISCDPSTMPQLLEDSKYFHFLPLSLF